MLHWRTCIAIKEDWAQRAKELNKKGVSFAEIFRQGIIRCEEIMEKEDL